MDRTRPRMPAGWTGPLPAGRGGWPVPRPQWGEVGLESFRIHLEQGFGAGEPGQAMTTEGAQANAGGQGAPGGALRLAGQQDLAAVGRRTDPSGGVDGEADISRLREGRPARVDAGADPAFEIARPPPHAQG